MNRLSLVTPNTKSYFEGGSGYSIPSMRHVVENVKHFFIFYFTNVSRRMPFTSYDIKLKVSFNN